MNRLTDFKYSFCVLPFSKLFLCIILYQSDQFIPDKRNTYCIKIRNIKNKNIDKSDILLRVKFVALT